MTDPAEGSVHEKETSPLNESATNAVVDIPDEVDPDDSKAHLINANGGAGGGDVDHLGGIDVKIVDGTATSSEAEVSFNGLGKDEVMKYADEPFWKRLRLILFILFWVGWFAMLVTAVIIIVLAPRCPPRPDLKWYHTDTIYQVLPKSFKDSNADGVGDFKGLQNKADYIFEELDAKVILLNSIYETDGLDSGLGVINHKEVGKWFNASADDIKSWIKTLRKEDKRVILDLIPNQTSKKHEWFIKSQKREGKYENYYVWAPNTTYPQPPNNWQSAYQGSAWEYDPVRKEFYLHQLSKDHPDLNLLNPDVIEEIKDIMSFWLDAGVAGFNIRGVEYLTENLDMKDNGNNSSQTLNYMDTTGVLEELRKVADSFSDKPGRERVLMATVPVSNMDMVKEYWGSSEGRRLHIVGTVLEVLNKNSKANEVAYWLDSMLSDELDRQQWFGLALSGDSVSRVANRMASPKKITIAHTLQMLLPGTPINYYGDEFGQKNGDVQGTYKVDKWGRDNYRTPMQWSSDKHAGFTTYDKPYLPVGADYMINHVDASSAVFSEETPLKFFKQLVELRGEESFQFGKTKVCAPDSDILLFTRQAERFPHFLTVINMGNAKKSLKLSSIDCVDSKDKGIVRFHTREQYVDKEFDFQENAILLEEGDVVVVEF